MRKDYIKPEAEMVKFVEEEEVMTEPTTSIGTIAVDYDNWFY